jgi:hypothetical protein
MLASFLISLILVFRTGCSFLILHVNGLPFISSAETFFPPKPVF